MATNKTKRGSMANKDIIKRGSDRDLVVPSEEPTLESQYAIMDFQDPQEAQLLIQENMGVGIISAQNLPNITVPGGGGLNWEVKDLEGVVSSPHLDGIIIAIKATRRFYIKDFAETGGGTPPDCFSTDGLIGHGRPGGDCMSCINNQFEKDNEGNSHKRCKERKMIFMVMKEDILPVVIHAPVMSIKPVTQYQINLTRKKIRMEHVYTRLSLLNDKSKGKNIKYSLIDPIKIGDVAKEKWPVIDAYVAALKPYLIKTVDDMAKFGNASDVK